MFCMIYEFMFLQIYDFDCGTFTVFRRPWHNKFTVSLLPFFAEVGGSDTHIARLYARPNLRQPYVAPRSEVESKIADLWRQTLHIDRVGVHDSFFELGGDSVLAAQVLSLAQKTFGIRINPQDA
ncbi:MAG: hypothetical protein EOO01_34225, partial [Chitinophagaceae bacterium]